MRIYLVCDLTQLAHGRPPAALAQFAPSVRVRDRTLNHAVGDPFQIEIEVGLDRDIELAALPVEAAFSRHDTHALRVQNQPTGCRPELSRFAT
jgi:hypothetical protein